MSSSRQLRLRVVVQRHALPEERVVFTLALDNDPTIAKFVEQVNDIIPLESSHWGLEDYAVEIRSANGRAYECLHFHPVASLLDKDDEVYIRPLDTDDHRRRRLSGRHQISSVGMHLIDGVAFGRPRLRTPRGRPSIDIPPLKRRRITPAAEAADEDDERHDDEEAEFIGFEDGPLHVVGRDSGRGHGHDEQPQHEDYPRLLTQHGEERRSPMSATTAVRFGDEDGHDREDNLEDHQDDVSFSDRARGDGDTSDDEMDHDWDYESIEDELRDLERDNARFQELENERGLASDQDQDQARPRESMSLAARQGETAAARNDRRLNLEDLDKLAALNKAFPHVPLSTCEQALLHFGRDLSKTYRSLRKRHEARLPHLDTHAPHMPQKTNLQAPTPQTAQDSAVSAAYADVSAAESDDESTNSTTRHFDQHGFPMGSIAAGTVAATLARSMRRSGKMVKSPVHIRFHDRSRGSTLGQDDEQDKEARRADGHSDQEDEEEDEQQGACTDEEGDEQPGDDEDGDDADGDDADDDDADGDDADDDDADDDDADDDDADDDAGDDDDNEDEDNGNDKLSDNFNPFVASSEDPFDPEENSSGVEMDVDGSTGGDITGGEGSEEGTNHNDESSVESSEDSGPEQTSSKQDPGQTHTAKFRANPQGEESSSSDDSSSTSSSGSDSDEEQDVRRRQVVSPPKKKAVVDGSSSSGGCSDNGSDSGSDSDGDGGSDSNRSDSESSSENDVESSEHEEEEINFEATNFPASPENRVVEPLNGGKVNMTLARVEALARPILPGQGSSATKKRNDRRRRNTQRQKAVEKATEEAGAVGSDGGFTKAGQSLNAVSAHVLAKKAALLQRLSNVGESSQNDKGERLHEEACSPLDARSAVLSSPRALYEGPTSPPSTHHQEPSNPGAQVASTSPNRAHKKLDVGAGRRMIFGALGLRTPKNKSDEEQIRTNLMKDVRPLINTRLAEKAASCGSQLNPDDQAAQSPVQDGGDEPNAWRQKIWYSATECVDEGVDLSEPPFPFIQRWDPQQQSRRGQRGARGKRKQLAEDELDYDEADGQPSQTVGAKRRKFGHGTHYEDPDSFMTKDADSTVISRDVSEMTSMNFDGSRSDVGHASHVGSEARTTSVKEKSTKKPNPVGEDEDLPSLPADLTKLPSLQAGHARPGMIITWKQWLLSSGTNWQPCVSSMTGAVVEVDPGASLIKIELAKRDRHRDGYDKTYDEEGNRIYGRFDAPDMDDEDSLEEAEMDTDAERGIRNLQFIDLMDPRILKDVDVAEETPLANPPHDLLGGPLAFEPASEQTTANAEEAEMGAGEGQPANHHPCDHQVDAADSAIPETDAEARDTSLEFQTADTRSPSVGMTEERRHEINLMVEDAGFREDVTPSLAKLYDRGSFLDMRHQDESSTHSTSPSRQLEELGDSIALKSVLSPKDAGVQGHNQDAQVGHPDTLVSSASSVSGMRQPDPAFPASQDDEYLPGFDDTEAIDLFASSQPLAYGSSAATKRSTAAATQGEKAVGSCAEEGTRSVSVESDSSDDSLPSPRRLSQVRLSQVRDEPSACSSDRLQPKDPAPAPAPARNMYGLAKKLAERPIERPAAGLQTTPALSTKTRRTVKVEPNMARSSNQFIPPGSQAISLLTSSPELEYLEHYADDVDETYGDVMPRGSGWVDKKTSGKRGLSRPLKRSRRRS